MIENFRRKYIGDTKFYRRYLALALPMILQNAITNLVNFLDNIMVGQLGTEQMSGVAIVNQLIFVFNLAIFGVVSAGSIFGAQYYGKGDHKGHMYSFRFKLYAALLVTGLAILLFVTKGTDLISLYLTDRTGDGAVLATLQYGRRYLGIMVAGLIPFAVNQSYATNIKETYTDEELERMRDSCVELRDLAIIDMLASTGMRIGEMVLLNKADINFNERECVVFGKGDKERIVYFDARTKIHLQNYIDSRTDDNPALFVTLRSPHERIKIGGIESRLREMGKQLDIQKVHPHKFRRTLATMAIDKGMPIEQLQQLLGHKRIDTTLQYAMVKQSNVKLAHKKYIG